MFSSRRPTRFALERLETRATPATINFVSGSLFITNPHGPIQVTQNAGGDFSIVDNGVNNGKYLVSNSMTITTTNLDDQVTVSLFPGKLLSGSLTINTLNGNDQVSVFGGGTGRVGGSLFINTSNGNDVINVGQTAGGADSGLRVGGGGVIAAGVGIDSLNVGTSKFGSSVAVTGANNFTLGVGGTSAQINGDLTVDNSGDFAAPNIQVYGVNSVVAGSFKYAGGTGNDNLTLAGTMCTVPARNAIIDAGTGNSTLNLTGIVGSFATADLIFKGSNNPLLGAQVSIAASAVVSGNLTLNMGEGANFYSLNTNFFIGGNLTITAGSDADNVGPIDAIINGNANVNLGAGDDSVEFGTMGAGVGFVGGNILANMGDGNDLVAVNEFVGSGPGSGQVTANLGAGSDSFMACDPVYSNYGKAVVDFGVDSDNDFGQVLFGVLSPFTTYVNVGGGDVITTC